MKMALGLVSAITEEGVTCNGWLGQRLASNIFHYLTIVSNTTSKCAKFQLKSCIVNQHLTIFALWSEYSL